MSEEAKGVIGRVACMVVTLIAVLKGLCILGERLNYEMGEKSRTCSDGIGTQAVVNCSCMSDMEDLVL